MKNLIINNINDLTITLNNKKKIKELNSPGDQSPDMQQSNFIFLIKY